MIESTVNGTKNPKEVAFPKLMVTKSGRVVYFASPEFGIEVKLGGGGRTSTSVSKTTTGWNMHCFEDFVGTVTLENKA